MVTDSASADSNTNPVFWSTVNQEYRSLLATTATFLQTHAFSDRRCRQSDSTSSSTGQVRENRVSIFEDEDHDSRAENDFSQTKSNHENWSFSVTVEVPGDGVNPDTEIPVSILFFYVGLSILLWLILYPFFLKADFPWVSSDPTTLSTRTPNPHLIHGDRIHPIRYTDLGTLQFNFYMEETDI